MKLSKHFFFKVSIISIISICFACSPCALRDEPGEKMDSEGIAMPIKYNNDESEELESGEQVVSPEKDIMENGEPPVSSSGTSGLMIELSLKELIDMAECIVTGTIIDSESAWNENHTSIYTFHTLSVDEYVKGHGKDQLIIKLSGGKVGDLEQSVEDAATLKRGENALLFLIRNEDDGSYRVAGGFQGKYTIENGMIKGLDLSFKELVDKVK